MCENANLIVTNNKNTLWIGNIESPQDLSFLDNNNIKTVFNITFFQYIEYNHIKYHHIALSDSDTPSSIKMFMNKIEVIDIIHQALNTSSVLVHCEMGAQRSAAIVAAYLMKYNQMDPDEAINYISSKRPLAFKHRVTFLEALYILKTNSDVLEVKILV